MIRAGQPDHTLSLSRALSVIGCIEPDRIGLLDQSAWETLPLVYPSSRRERDPAGIKNHSCGSPGSPPQSWRELTLPDLDQEKGALHHLRFRQNTGSKEPNPGGWFLNLAPKTSGIRQTCGRMFHYTSLIAVSRGRLEFCRASLASRGTEHDSAGLGSTGRQSLKLGCLGLTPPPLPA